MKERPILFSGPMVRALLAGTKTQTRRVVKMKPHHQIEERDDGTPWPWMHDGERNADSWLACPYGQPGDRLWVRESWSPDPPCDGTWAYTSWAGCREGQIAGVPERFRRPELCNYAADWTHGLITWTPSIHMPRWASRITLEITSVRVERLQEISMHDVGEEGIGALLEDPDSKPGQAFNQAEHAAIAGFPGRFAPEIRGYAALWDQINGADSWSANPWVWVVEFKPVATTS